MLDVCTEGGATRNCYTGERREESGGDDMLDDDSSY